MWLVLNFASSFAMRLRAAFCLYAGSCVRVSPLDRYDGATSCNAAGDFKTGALSHCGSPSPRPNRHMERGITAAAEDVVTGGTKKY